MNQFFIKYFFLQLTTLLCLINASFASNYTFDNLVKRDGLYYEKFSSLPFTGKITKGKKQGSLVNGKPKGTWFIFYDNGQLKQKCGSKNGELHGQCSFYWDNGQLKRTCNYSKGLNTGCSNSYYKSGKIEQKVWKDKNNRKITHTEAFYENGNLKFISYIS